MTDGETETSVMVLMTSSAERERVRERGGLVKVKCALVQALRLCTGGTAHRGSRGIAIL
jgi:hypothetical protein